MEVCPLGGTATAVGRDFSRVIVGCKIYFTRSCNPKCGEGLTAFSGIRLALKKKNIVIEGDSQVVLKLTSIYDAVFFNKVYF